MSSSGRSGQGIGKTWRTIGTIFVIVAVSAMLYGIASSGDRTQLAFAVAAVFFALAGVGYLIDAMYERRSSVIERIIAYLIAVSYFVIAAISLLTIR